MFLLRAEPDTLFERIARLSRQRHGFRLAVLGAACLHAWLVSVLSNTQTLVDAPGSSLATELVVELPPTPPPPDDPAQEPLPKPEVQASPRPAPPRSAPATPAPVPASAAAVLSRSEASEQPLDFTDSIVTGTAERYAGGVTNAQATGQRFSRSAGAPSAGRTPNANGASPELGLDRSRAPGVLGGLAWNCPFPAEADVDGVDQAQVTIRVEVDASGRLTRAQVLSDPGHGFAEAARRCALNKRFSPGADRWGRPSTSGINLSVRFVR